MPRPAGRRPNIVPVGVAVLVDEQRPAVTQQVGLNCPHPSWAGRHLTSVAAAQHEEVAYDVGPGGFLEGASGQVSANRRSAM